MLTYGRLFLHAVLFGSLLVEFYAEVIMESVLGQEREGLGSRSSVNLGSWLFSGSVTSEKSFIPVSLGLVESAIM